MGKTPPVENLDPHLVYPPMNRLQSHAKALTKEVEGLRVLRKEGCFYKLSLKAERLAAAREDLYTSWLEQLQGSDRWRTSLDGCLKHLTQGGPSPAEAYQEWLRQQVGECLRQCLQEELEEVVMESARDRVTHVVEQARR